MACWATGLRGAGPTTGASASASFLWASACRSLSYFSRQAAQAAPPAPAAATAEHSEALALCCLQGLPLSSSPGAVAMHAVVLGVMGLAISWPAPACNNPIFAGEAGGVPCWAPDCWAAPCTGPYTQECPFASAPSAEIVPPHMRNLIYAFDRSFEGAIAVRVCTCCAGALLHQVATLLCTMDDAT